MVNDHFEMVKERYKQKYGDKSGGDWEEVPNAPMDQNEATRGFRKR